MTKPSTSTSAMLRLAYLANIIERSHGGEARREFEAVAVLTPLGAVAIPGGWETPEMARLRAWAINDEMMRVVRTLLARRRWTRRGLKIDHLSNALCNRGIAPSYHVARAMIASAVAHGMLHEQPVPNYASIIELPGHPATPSPR